MCPSIHKTILREFCIMEQILKQFTVQLPSKYEVCSKNKANFQILQDMYIKFSFFIVMLVQSPQHMLTLSAILNF